MTSGYCSQHSQGSFRAQIHKLRKANKYQFDLPGQRQLFRFSTGFLSEGVISRYIKICECAIAEGSARQHAIARTAQAVKQNNTTPLTKPKRRSGQIF